jgi:hypothetical protein
MKASIRVNVDDVIRKLQSFKSRVGGKAWLDLDLSAERGIMSLSDDHRVIFHEFEGSVIYEPKPDSGTSSLLS